MYLIGIDMSKDSFHVALDEERVLVFANNKEGVNAFLSTLLKEGVLKELFILGVEATGAYHLLLAETARSRGWCIRILNPLLTSRMAQTSLRRVKTDKTDAVMIRKCLMTEGGYRYSDTPEVLALKTLVQEREALCHVRATLKQRQHAHVYKQRAVTIPLHDSFTKTVTTITSAMRAIERKTQSYAQGTQALLQSIPGIGPTSAAALVAYVGDVTRFTSPEKLVAYLGLDPRVHESGTSVHGKGYISKRGNASLRSLLFNAAFIAKRRNPELKKFFDKKIAEGKHYFKALCATERKLVHLIYAVWKRGTPYEVR